MERIGDAIPALVGRSRALTPPVSRGAHQRRYRRRRYRPRTAAGRFLARIEECRGVATGYGKLDGCDLALAQPSSVVAALTHPQIALTA